MLFRALTRAARPDAPVTLSKSCTDKLALKQCTSLLNSISSLLLAPHQAYLDTLIIPESQYVSVAFERAFKPTGRFKLLSRKITQDWSDGYDYKPSKVTTTSREFRFSKRMTANATDRVPSNISAVWTPYFQEVLIGGVQQGRKQFDARGASMTCRKRIWDATVKVVASVNLTNFSEVMKIPKYTDVKQSNLLADRRQVKEDVRRCVLQGWVRNEQDDDFGL